MKTFTPLYALHSHIKSHPYMWICFAMIVGVMGTALASPLYPLYQNAWLLSTGEITVLYVGYMAAALSSLLFLGRISDQRGYVIALRAGLIIVTLGIFFSAVSWSFGSFLLSRIVIGLASSLIVTSASIGLTRLNKSSDLGRAAATTSLLIAFGFGLGPVLGGLIAQWAAIPLRTSYVPSVVMGIVAIYTLFSMPADQPLGANTTKTTAFWRPSLHIPAADKRTPFLLGAFTAFTAFAMFSLFASLAPSFMSRMVPWDGPAVSGLSIGFILFMSAGFQLLVRQWPLKRTMILGLCTFVASNGLLALNLKYSSSGLFISSVVLLALGHGLCLISGMGIVNRIALPAQRAATTSSYLIIAYCGAILPILGIGYLADYFGMVVALNSFCASLAALCLCLALLTWRRLKIATD